jgi:hypothetical protein
MPTRRDDGDLLSELKDFATLIPFFVCVQA